MDSLLPHPSNYDAIFSATTRRRGSTSQVCLHRILATITTVPPPSPAKPSLLEPKVGEGSRCAAECSRFELNSLEAKESLSSTGGGSDVDEEDGGDRAERSLTLLIKAVKLILGEFLDGDESALEKDDKAAAENCVELDETAPSPMVRSKRERTRVLPCRYRDSVLEPFTRLSRPGSAVISAKRRRR